MGITGRVKALPVLFQSNSKTHIIVMRPSIIRKQINDGIIERSNTYEH